MAYLISRYPAISHTFILREVLRLREMGFDIHTASINRPDRAHEKLTQEERDEAAATFYVKVCPPHRIALAHFACLFSAPLDYLGGLLFALRLGRNSAGALALHLFYFIEAVLIGHWMGARNLKHLHVHFATPAATVGMIVSKTFPIGFSLTVHGPDEFYEVTENHLREKIEAASFLCCIGRFCRSQLMKLSDPCQWNKIEIAPLGVDTEVFHPQPPGHHPGFEILCVGRLVPAKGQAILVAAVSELVGRGRQVHLHLVGDGPDRGALERLAEQKAITENVTFHGAVNQDHIRVLYARADAFVLPSFAEGIPVVLMEAMAMEIAVVSTIINGIPELIESEKEGLLVPPSDAERLREAIERLMDDSGFRLRLAQAGRVKVIESYHLRRNVERLAGIFERRLGAEA